MPRTARSLCLAALAALAVLSAPLAALAAEPAPVLLHQGERFLRMGNLGFAKSNYEKVIANYEGTPEAAEAHGDLGVIAARQGDDELAMAQYAKAIAGGYQLAHFNMGQALLRRPGADADPALRDAARAHFQAFARYLDSDAPKPPVLVHSLPEVRAELDAALKRLR